MNTRILSEERFRRLAEKSGWTVARAQGYSEGKIARAKDAPPSAYAMVGTDEYAVGYREGYFRRQSASETLPAPSDIGGKESNTGPS